MWCAKCKQQGHLPHECPQNIPVQFVEDEDGTYFQVTQVLGEEPVYQVVGYQSQQRYQGQNNSYRPNGNPTL